MNFSAYKYLFKRLCTIVLILSMICVQLDLEIPAFKPTCNKSLLLGFLPFPLIDHDNIRAVYLYASNTSSMFL